MRAPRVYLTIDRLVLRGFAADQRDAIAGRVGRGNGEPSRHDCHRRSISG